MVVLEVGANVFHLRFLPDGRRLLVGTSTADRVVAFEVWTLPGGDRVRLPLSGLKEDDRYQAYCGHAIAVHPSGDAFHLAWGGRLYAFRTADGTPLPAPDGVRADQVIASPDGRRLVVADCTRRAGRLLAYRVEEPGGPAAPVWDLGQAPEFRHAAGFLPDGERIVTVDIDRVRVRAFDTGAELAGVRYPAGHAYQPQISPDGRHLGVIGYSCMYVYDLPAPGGPRRIGGTQSFGRFLGFAFHPSNGTMAVIHGGPTLVKLYDLNTLKLIHKYNWKVGGLGCVAFSPDGTLGAAGSFDGRIVVWDVDS